MHKERVKSLGKAKQADRSSKEHLYKEALSLFPGFLCSAGYELCNLIIGDLLWSLKGSTGFLDAVMLSSAWESYFPKGEDCQRRVSMQVPSCNVSKHGITMRIQASSDWCNTFHLQTDYLHALLTCCIHQHCAPSADTQIQLCKHCFLLLPLPDPGRQAYDHQHQEERCGKVYLRCHEHGWGEGERDCSTYCAR